MLFTTKLKKVAFLKPEDKVLVMRLNKGVSDSTDDGKRKAFEGDLIEPHDVAAESEVPIVIANPVHDQ